jgi:hypothetical protein
MGIGNSPQIGFVVLGSCERSAVSHQLPERAFAFAESWPVTYQTGNSRGWLCIRARRGTLGVPCRKSLKHWALASVFAQSTGATIGPYYTFI